MIAADEYLVSGSMKLDDLNGWLNLKLESEAYDSIGGLVIGLLDHLPEAGEEVCHEGLRLVVESVEKNRIEKIHLYILNEEENGEISGQEEQGKKDQEAETESAAS